MFYSHWLFDEQLDSNNVFFLHKYVKNCRKCIQGGTLPVSKTVVRYFSTTTV